jgi:membrane protease YdiL (CAAX protease family)
MNPSENVLKPMPIWESALIGAVIAGLGVVCFHFLRPQFERAGLGEYAAYLLSLSIVFMALLTWSFIAFLREGHHHTLTDFLQRTRLDCLVKRWLVWSVGLGLVMFLATMIFSPIMAQLISRGALPLPGSIPDYLNPLQQRSIAGIRSQLVSQGVLLLIPLILILNIISEEIFWRGIVLPRQELTHGRNAFWVHGVIWALTHLFQYWLLIPILIGSITLAYTIQRTKCTWIGIIAHLLNNGIPFIIMIFI